MYTITNHQINLLEESKREGLIEKLLPKLKELKPDYLPTTDIKIREYLHHKIIESKKWELENDALIEKYLYLCLSYKKINPLVIPEKYSRILTWPSRSSDDKLNYLHDSLIQDHYVVKSK